MTEPVQFKKILVANRGEIAVRIFRACTELSIETVAIYSHEDRYAIHRYKADEAWQVGVPGEPLGGYLNIDEIVALAKSRGVDAIHPGYGFLSENPDMARACKRAGIVFIGPSADAIDALGDKVSARTIAQNANVPVIPGTKEPVPSVAEAKAFAKDAGYPVMVKAAFGGGGRGMRRVFKEEEMDEAFNSAKREATAAFSNGALFIEKLVQKPRHIEVQVLGDHTGHCVHLFERDCSVQRRHQKVVEVAPALHIDAPVLERMYSDAVRVASAAKMSNACTVEFLLDGDDPTKFYFIEVNPRVQVEHTITELITGIDIVQTQIRVAEGHTLKDLGLHEQSQIKMRGSAIQCRITTEDPRNNFAPDTGRVTAYRSAAGFGIRLDSGVSGSGAVVTPYYDSMLVKVSGFGLTHEDATKKVARSLSEFRIRGVQTNIPFLQNIVNHPQFKAGTLDTGFVEREKAIFKFPRRQNRASRMLHSLADTIVNGPPNAESPLARPAITVHAKVPEGHPNAAASFKRILDEKGPDAVAASVLNNKRLLLTDTTFRDAHQSLLATRVRTYDIARIAAQTESRLGNAFSVECWGGATFDVAFRFLREDPWARLRTLRKKMPNTLLQMLLRGSNAVGYANYPSNVIEKFIGLAANEGVDVFRIFDCFNKVEAMQLSIDTVRAHNKLAEVCICYTGDPRDKSRPLYTFDYYKRKAAECAKAGAHMLAIKDMAGLCKPQVAGELVRVIKEESGLPVHFHTHDTSGNGVAAMLAAAHAGVDVVDGALSSMSGLTSQPSLNAIVAGLEGTEREVECDADELQELSDYWESVRTWYKPFESGLLAPSADVYKHEIPGGQYSNLKPQAFSVGLAEQWPVVRDRYREVNDALGDLIKVTPSSKVVGDFALWLVANDMTVAELLKTEGTPDVPASVIGFFKGAIGIPEGPFPEELRHKILGDDAGPAPKKGLTTKMAPYDFVKKRAELEKLHDGPITETLEISYALYPKVIREYLGFIAAHGDVSVVDTETFFYGLSANREIAIDLEPGKSLIVALAAISDRGPAGTRMVHFLLNGQPRAAVVVDKSVKDALVRREKADVTDDRHLGAPMPGAVVRVAYKSGESVKKGETLLVLEAMKLETTVKVPRDGTLVELKVAEGDRLEAGDLIAVIA